MHHAPLQSDFFSEARRDTNEAHLALMRNDADDPVVHRENTLTKRMPQGLTGLIFYADSSHVSIAVLPLVP